MNRCMGRGYYEEDLLGIYIEGVPLGLLGAHNALCDRLNFHDFRECVRAHTGIHSLCTDTNLLGIAKIRISRHSIHTATSWSFASTLHSHLATVGSSCSYCRLIHHNVLWL